jgi:Calpain family cysteine protease
LQQNVREGDAVTSYIAGEGEISMRGLSSKDKEVFVEYLRMENPYINPLELERRLRLQVHIYDQMQKKNGPQKVDNVRLKVLHDAPLMQGVDNTADLAAKIKSMLNITADFKDVKQIVHGHDPTNIAVNSFYDYFGIAQKYVKAKATRFVDEDFKYGMDSVAHDKKEQEALISKWLYIKWMGISRFYPNPLWIDQLDHIKPSDINQGELGNCYFLASLSSLALNPARIQKLFIKQSREKPYDQQGPWGIWICVGGIWRQVIVDEYFPFNDQYVMTPYFCKPRSGIVWPMIIEKCWAKVSYSYADSVAGTCMEALHCLTGAPSFAYKIKSMDMATLVNLIKRSCKNRFVITASSKNNDGLPTEGITTCHAYSLFDIKYLIKDPVTGKISLVNDNVSTQEEVILKLRNPLGPTNKWFGRYSRNHSDLTPELKKCLYQDPSIETGEFWISGADFKKHFNDLDICHYRDDYVYTSFPMRKQEPNFMKIGNIESLIDLPYIYEIIIEAPGEYYFGANQIPMRIIPPKIKNIYYRIIRASLLLYKYNQDGTKLEYINGNASNLVHTFIQCENLQPGKYYLALAGQFFSNYNFITLSAYGPREVSLNLIHDSKSKDTIKILEYLYLEIARNKPLNEYQISNGYPAIRYLHEIRQDGYGYFLFKNTSKQMGYRVECHLTELENIMFLSVRKLSNSNWNAFTFVLIPDQEAFFLYIQRDTPAKIKFQLNIFECSEFGQSQITKMPANFGRNYQQVSEFDFDMPSIPNEYMNLELHNRLAYPEFNPHRGFGPKMDQIPANQIPSTKKPDLNSAHEHQEIIEKLQKRGIYFQAIPPKQGQQVNKSNMGPPIDQVAKG